MIETNIRSATTRIMGIINITPDSFSDGGKYMTVSQALLRGKQMIKEGVDIIDVGGESSRPGAKSISEGEEIHRVIPVIQALRQEIGNVIPISIDTYKHTVADQALSIGASMVNSLGGFSFDPQLAQVIAKRKCPIIMYHIQGKPSTMQEGDILYTDIIKEIIAFFTEQISIGECSGITPSQYILDPGIGFGKTVEQNIILLQRLREFAILKKPLAIGVSRKSHLGMLLQQVGGKKAVPLPTQRLEAALAETAIAILQGVSIIRTHDVRETKKFVQIFERIWKKIPQTINTIATIEKSL